MYDNGSGWWKGDGHDEAFDLDEELIKGAKAIASDMRVGDTRRIKLAKVVVGKFLLTMGFLVQWDGEGTAATTPKRKAS